jgi:hypothetical protein
MLKERGLDANQILKKANLHTHTGEALGHTFVNDQGVVQALTSNGFPHQPNGRSTQLPATFDNFHHLAKAYGISIRYNEITKKTSIDIPHLKTSIDNADNVKRSHIMLISQTN